MAGLRICKSAKTLYPTGKVRNKLKRMVNGNIAKSMKVSNWNSGSKFYKNKIPEIQTVLDTRKPDLMLISEANVFLSDLDHELVTPGYTLQKTKTWDEVGNCRLVALVRDSLKLETADSWMDGNISSIWYNISSRWCKTLYLGGIYREHTILQQDHETDSESQCNSRLKIFIKTMVKCKQKR